MARKIMPIERVVEEAENPTSLFVDPDDLVEVNPADLNDMLDEDDVVSVEDLDDDVAENPSDDE